MYINEYFNSRDAAKQKGNQYGLKSATIFQCKNGRWCLNYNDSPSNYSKPEDSKKEKQDESVRHS